MPHKHFHCKKIFFQLHACIIISVISFTIAFLQIPISCAVEVIQDIHLRGIATGNTIDIPMAIIEDSSSGRINAYRMHELVNGYEIVEILQDGILLKKGEKEVRVSLSNQSSFGHEDEEYQGSEMEFFTFQRDQIDTEKLSDQILTEPVPDVEKKEYEPIGITVADIKEGNFLNIMGIKPGDVLLEFNDYEINQPGDLEDAIKKLSTAENGMIRIAFKRNGKYDTRYGELR